MRRVCVGDLTPQILRSLIRQSARKSLRLTLKLHAITVTTSLNSSPHTFLLNALAQAYAQHGQTLYARKLFDIIPHSHKDTVDWSTLMHSLYRHDNPLHAIHLFTQMTRQNIRLDSVVMVCVFNACAKLREFRIGIQGHAKLVRIGLEGCVKGCNAVLDMYFKCGGSGIRDAKRVFDRMADRNVVSWTVVLDGILRTEGVLSGRKVFDLMPERNVVAWTVMVKGYVASGMCREGFELVSEMVFGFGIHLGFVTLCSVLSGCVESGDVVMGKWVHVYALKSARKGMEMDVMVATSLVDMYAKCGRIRDAVRVFECMVERNRVAWNAVIGGLAMHGRGREVLDMFCVMVGEVEPDELTFTSVLSGCSHSGLVDEGRRVFGEMESVYGIRPEMEHYACMVDLLGRSGLLEEAENLVRTMPMRPNEVVLGSLLGACNVHGKLQLGERILQELVQIDLLNTEYHVLLSNMYALEGKKDKSMSIRQVLKKRGIKKVPGMSFIHVKGTVHQFAAGDKSHHRTREIYVMLDEVIRRLRFAGYVPNTTSQVFASGDGVGNVTEECEDKEQAIFSHSEKLALCFGLISTPPGSPLYIFKNLRTCQDCHSAMKIASDVYNRDIVVRDRNRFHFFKQGSCSCLDYW